MTQTLASPETREQDSRESPRTKIRWVTWYPIGYWYPRFDELARRPGVDLEVVFLSPSSHLYEEFPLSAVNFPYRVLPSAPKRWLGDASRLVQNAFDIANGDEKLIIHYKDKTCALASMVRRLHGRPYYVFVANSFRDRRPSSYVSDAAKRFIFQAAEACLVTGPLQIEYARHYAGANKRIATIGNPIGSEYFRSEAEATLPVREELRRARGWSDRFVVGYVGRHSTEKDLPTLIRAVARLRSSGAAVLLVLAGAGPQQADLRALATQLGAPVEFPGFLQDRALSEFYAALDAFVLPSTSEPWGLVVNEAMEFGLPVVVSSNVGCQHLIQPGESGIIFPAGDVEHLATQLSQLIDKPDKRVAIGAAGRRRIAFETPARWADAVLDGLRAAA